MVVNLPMRLDPLAMLAQTLASRRFLASSALALVTVALTLVLGRVWCSWLCPLGTLLDWMPLRRLRGRRQPPPDSWRAAKYGLLLTLLSAALLTNLTLMVFDPLTILFRTLSAAVWPAIDQLATAAQFSLYRSVPGVRPLLDLFDRVMRPVILPAQPAFYRATLLYAGIFVSIVGLNVVAHRFWCRYLCPLGALLGVPSKVALFRRRVNASCNQCGACARACPTGTIQATQDYASDSSECIMCAECQRVCPQRAIDFPVHTAPAARHSYDPSRRQALLSFTGALAAIGLFRSDLAALREHPLLIRPPGARENDLLSKCIRCGECNRACPTSAIQPAIAEAAVEGFWTPVLIPRLGYCDYSCNACGQVCPVQAIPPLSLAEKRQVVIGQAYIDTARCIPWADYRDCIVCEEMCPVPDKAIKLDTAEVINGNGEKVVVHRPVVVRDRCIGCGICEFKCPVNGQAAIRVFVPGSAELR